MGPVLARCTCTCLKSCALVHVLVEALLEACAQVHMDLQSLGPVLVEAFLQACADGFPVTADVLVEAFAEADEHGNVLVHIPQKYKTYTAQVQKNTKKSISNFRN